MKSRKLNLRQFKITEDKFKEGVLYRLIGFTDENSCNTSWFHGLAWRLGSSFFGMHNFSKDIYKMEGYFFGSNYLFVETHDVKKIEGKCVGGENISVEFE